MKSSQLSVSVAQTPLSESCSQTWTFLWESADDCVTFLQWIRQDKMLHIHPFLLLRGLYQNRSKDICWVLWWKCWADLGGTATAAAQSRPESQTFWRDKHPELYRILLWSGGGLLTRLQQRCVEVTPIAGCLCNVGNVDFRLELEEKCSSPQ